MRMEQILKGLLFIAVVLVAFSVCQQARAACNTADGVTCCGRVYLSPAGQCCWEASCSNGTSSGGCGGCTVAGIKDGPQKDHIHTEESILLAQLLENDKELSRALNSIK